MWQIIINGPGYFDTTYDLPEGVTYFGRADDNDIVLSGDQVSRRHAKIEVRASGAAVEDLGSRNGTEINGKRIEGPQPIRAGDILGIGENSLSLRQPSANESAKTDPIDVAQMAASGLQGVAISGEIVLTQTIDKNPYLEQFGRAGQIDPKKMVGPSQTEERNLEEFESLFLLIKVSEKLNTSVSLKQFLEDVIQLVVDVAQARTGVVLVRDERGKLKPMVVRHAEALASGEVPVSDAVLAEVAKKKVALAVMDAKGDQRFSARESVLLYDLDQVICVPMVKDDELLGIIYLNRKAGESLPLRRLVDVVRAIAHMAANGVESWRLREKALAEERMRKALERFHAPAIVERVMNDLRSPDKAGAYMEPKEVTVMFADISGFTPLTERLPPERIVDLLNEYYSRMTQVIFSFDGTVDKFIGDAVMAVFGAPYARPDDASRAVRCALACRREFVEMMRKRPLSELCGIKIGLNTGKVLAGTLGSEARIEYTCLGDAVNIASRLQSSASPGQVLITGKTLAAIGARFDVAPLG
ncbi:MAG: FHA domain-containing protein, partial [Deltaproteobacteria bacterium]|nr:FHA domain-containing protein [Deltaproteobacteria bacterium]